MKKQHSGKSPHPGSFKNDHKGQTVKNDTETIQLENEGKRLSEIAQVDNEISYQQLFNNSPLPTVIAEVNSMCILDFNSATIEQYGFSKEELLLMKLPDFLPKDQQEKLKAQKDNVKSGMRNDLGTIYHVKKNGEKILVEISVTLITYKFQEAFLATAKDITERERLQEEIVKQKVNYQKKITKAVIDAQEKERNEIGKELHDNVSQLLVAKESSLCAFIIEANSTIYIFGGEPFQEDRFIDWNFVASDMELIKNAKQKWMAQAFDKIKGDEIEFVPYPTLNKK